MACLSTVTGERFTLVGPLAGGETGATEVLGEDRRRLVLKWDHDAEGQVHRRASAVLADRLRLECGWPVPEQRVVDGGDVIFVLQQLMAGSPVRVVTHGLVDDVLAAHDRRLGLTNDAAGIGLAEELVTTLRDGGRGYCLHAPLRDFDRRTQRIIERIEAIGREVSAAELRGTARTDDIVHFDLHPGNMLQVDGRLSAVVDLDFAKVGDATFDLTTLALASLAYEVERGVRTRLFDVGVHGVGEPRRSAYLGHLLVRLLDWPIRKGRRDEVEFWIEQADRLLSR